MLLHKKYESRDARLKSLMPDEGNSIRYRNFGDTSTASSAVAMPSSKESPCRRASVTYPRYSPTSAEVAGRRKARPMMLDRIVRAHASVFCEQTKILPRLSGEGPAV